MGIQDRQFADGLARAVNGYFVIVVMNPHLTVQHDVHAIARLVPLNERRTLKDLDFFADAGNRGQRIPGGLGENLDGFESSDSLHGKQHAG